MKVRVVSDLHLEFSKGWLDMPEGDVLILAGDICVATNYDEYHPFFEQCVEKYNKVFYVMGNHEHYGGNFNETWNILNLSLPSGITLMNNRSEYYGGVHFIGATMWSNMDNFNFNTMKEAQDCMNDYHTVLKNDGRALTPLDTIDEHMFSRGWFEQAIPTLNGDVFVITHHAPSSRSVRGRYKALQGAYSTDMERFITDNPNIRWWVHGHVHKNNDYQIGDCRVISNPRGYHGMETNPDFKVDFEIEI